MLKFSIHLTQGRRSFSEVHYGNFSGAVSNMRTQAESLITQRAQVCGANAFVDRVVVSSSPANHRTSTYRLSPVTPVLQILGGSAVDNKAEMANNAPLVKWDGLTIGDAPLPAPPANYYPGGCWDSLFSTSGPDPGELNKSSGGYALLQQWVNYLIAGKGLSVPRGSWCYRTRNPVGLVPGQGLVAQVAAPFLLGVVTQAQLVDPTVGGNPPLVPGNKVYLSGWRVDNPRRKNLQGAFKIQSIVTAAGPPATWTYFLYGTANWQLTNWPIPGNIGPLLFTFASYVDFEIAQWVTRKRGESYDRALGKSPIHRTV